MVKETSKNKECDLVRKSTTRIYYVAKARFKQGGLSQFDFDQIKRNLAEIEKYMFEGEDGP